MYIYRVDYAPYVDEDEDFNIHLRSFSTFENAFSFITLRMKSLNQIITSLDHTTIDETEEEQHYYYVEDNFNTRSTYTIHKELVDYISFDE